jgi:transcriptional repressor NrdR
LAICSSGFINGEMTLAHAWTERDSEKFGSAIKSNTPMHCPFCGSDDNQVKDSRPVEEGGSIRRRRQCTACGARFTTFERIQLRELTVIKRDGRRVPFDREKFKRSIMIATRKRGIDEERIERLVNGIVREIEITGETEIEAKRLGALVMQRLAELDQVAYVRFASVYRDFTGVKDFEQFIARMGIEVEADDAAVRRPDARPRLK